MSLSLPKESLLPPPKLSPLSKKVHLCPRFVSLELLESVQVCETKAQDLVFGLKCKKKIEIVVAVVFPGFEVSKQAFPGCDCVEDLVKRESAALERLMLEDFRKIARVSQLLSYEW